MPTLSDLIGDQKPGLLIGNGINRFDSDSGSWESLLDQLGRARGVCLSKAEMTEMSNTEFFDILDLARPKEEKISLQSDFCNLMAAWKPASHHTRIVNWARRHNAPIVTVNFDENLSRAVGARFVRDKDGFTDYYPWSSYFSDSPMTDVRSSFGIWHAHGMMRYPRSIRLGLTHYMGSVQRARSWVFNSGGLRSSASRGEVHWRGENTWLDVLLFSPLLIVGFAFGKDENFLRWLFLERARLHKIVPDRKAKTWYVSVQNSGSLHRKPFFERIGMDFETVAAHADIYESPFWES